jgi:hypothetical protein
MRFCPKCGAAQQERQSCGKCGKPLESDWAVCPYCGTRASGEFAESLEPDGTEEPGLPDAGAEEPEKAGLYDGDTYRGAMDLLDAIAWIALNAKDGGNYRIVVGKDETVSYIAFLYEGKKDITVTLKGSGAERTVQQEDKMLMPMFFVYSGVTVILEDGVTLAGNKSKDSPRPRSVGVWEGGIFVMNGGKISGSGCGGVHVGAGGTFTMKGGTISGNSAKAYGGGVYVASSSSFTMKGGTISGNSANECGGGVYVESGGTFKSQGGVIYGSNASEELRNTAARGAAVYTGDNKYRETTARAGTAMDSDKEGLNGGWEMDSDEGLF